LTEGGREIDASDVHPWKTRSPRDLTAEGISMVGRDLHPENALALTYFIVLGRVIDSSLLQSENMSESTRPVPWGSSYFLNPLMRVRSGTLQDFWSIFVLAFSNSLTASSSERKRSLLE
jgi:hypothetical protein